MDFFPSVFFMRGVPVADESQAGVNSPLPWPEVEEARESVGVALRRVWGGGCGRVVLPLLTRSLWPSTCPPASPSR